MNHWQTIAAIDSDAKACEVYRANFPGVPVICGRVEAATLIRGMADVILAGFPCQPHSLAGDRKASADERDGGDAFIEAIATVRPRMFLGENVPGILSSEGGRYVQRLLERMRLPLGYRVEVKTLDAVDFGVPQFRNRVWFWGIRADVEAVHRWPTRTHMDPSKRGALFGEDLPAWVTCREAVGDGSNGSGGVPRVVAQQSHADEPRPFDEPASSLRSGGKGHDGCCVRIVAMYAKHAPAAPAPTVQAKWYKGGAEGLVALDEPSQTIQSGGTETGGAEPLRHKRNLIGGDPLPAATIFGEPVKWIRRGDTWMRRLSPRECARLQSVPDDFVWPESVSKSARYRIVGNGVACGIAVHLGREFAAADPQSRTVLDLFCGGGLWACGWHGRAWQRKAVMA